MQGGGGHTMLLHIHAHTMYVKRLLHLILELHPVPLSHGWVLQVLNQRHCPFERLNLALHKCTDGPISLVLSWEGDNTNTSKSHDGHMIIYLTLTSLAILLSFLSMT